MGLAYNFILMEANLKEIGSMINNMALVQKYGRMEQNTQAHTNSDKDMVTELICGPMGAIILDSFVIVKQKGQENAASKMVDNIMETGCKTKCMVKEYFTGQVVKNIKENFLMT